MSESALQAEQVHFVADLEQTPLAGTDAVDESTPPGGLWLGPGARCGGAPCSSCRR
jgi:hypothetical protein